MLCAICHTTNAADAITCRSCGSPLTARTGAPSTTALQPGTKLYGGQFTVGKPLGVGGFGITYLGADTSLRRTVAIKEFFPQGCTRQGTAVQAGGTLTVTDYQHARQKFLEEARVLAKFCHKNVVQVYTAFEENNTAYMVMEFVSGTTLLKLLETRGPLPENEVIGYMIQVADALATIHAQGVLHRDIKPENLMVTDDGRIVLVDFGAARDFARGKTRRMTAILTPGYAPLEQYGQHARFGPFTDLYALAATCYHLLTGQVPIQATDRASGVELPPPHRLNPQISKTVSDAVMWAMTMRAEQRPQSADQFISALRGLAPSSDGQPKNPYEARMAYLADELNKPMPSFSSSVHDVRIGEINRRLGSCSTFRAPDVPSCPACGSASLQAVTGQFTDACPLCRVGKLRRRKFDLDKCPVCRQDTIIKEQLQPPVVFCPLCQRNPLTRDMRKMLGLPIDLWWVCSNCKAEFDIRRLPQPKVKLVRYQQHGCGLADKYCGKWLPMEFWLNKSPQANVRHVCNGCGALFYEFPNGSMMLVSHRLGNRRGTVPPCGTILDREQWAKLAHNLMPNAGNSYCAACGSDFVNEGSQTMRLVDFDVSRFAWAAPFKDKSLPLSAWPFISTGKQSLHPGWLCKNCMTEFDDDQSGLKLVHSSAPQLSSLVGTIMSLADWHRVVKGVPTAAEESALRSELAQLEKLRQQEETRFLQAEQDRRNRLREELVGLVKKSVLGGFIAIPTGPERLLLKNGEVIGWSSLAKRLKLRSCYGQLYWDVDKEGTFLVTNQRIVFDTPDAQRWQRRLSKLHTVRIEQARFELRSTLGGHSNPVNILVLAFDDLQRPVGFWIGEMEITLTINGHPCAVTLTTTDVAELIHSQLRS